MLGNQFLILEARHFDMDVDAVEQETGDAFLVFGNDAGRAGAGFDWVTIIVTRQAGSSLQRRLGGGEENGSTCVIL